MKKQKRKGLRVQDSKNVGSGSASGKVHEIRSTPRGVKGPPRKKPLPPWREVRDKIK
jgi:hypothetical protein